MDLNKKLVDNSCKEKINNKKEKLTKLKKDISDINEKRKQLKIKLIEEQKKREKQNKNTNIFFNNTFSYLKQAVCDSISGYACCYKTSESDSENYYVDPVFWPGFINLELLHNLCYTYGIILSIIYDDEENNAYMYFEVCPSYELNELKFNELKISNFQNMNNFYEYLTNSNIQLIKNDSQKVK